MSARMLVALASFALALPLAACGGTVEGTGGGGSGGEGAGTTGTTSGTGTSDSTCVSYCKSLLACAPQAECVLTDTAAAQASCEAGCAAGFASLTVQENAVVRACLDCVFAINDGGACFEDLPFDSCKAKCDSDEVEEAGEKWSKKAQPSSNDPAFKCTNGKVYGSDGECSFSSDDGTTCEIACCNGTCGPTPDVAVSCDAASGPATCTCNAGKNKGKTFQSEGGCDVEIWNECNL